MFFVKHVIVWMFFLCCTSSLASLVPPTEVAVRSAMLLTVLLVTAGYRHMISQWIPRRPYHTLLDIYVLIAFLLQFLVLLEVLVISIGGWVVSHAVFASCCAARLAWMKCQCPRPKCRPCPRIPNPHQSPGKETPHIYGMVCKRD